MVKVNLVVDNNNEYSEYTAERGIAEDVDTLHSAQL